MALENVASVKRLERAPADDWGLERTGGPALDILPNARLQFSSRFTATGPDRPVNPYLGIVVGLEGLSADALITDLNNRVQHGDGARLPDLIACVGNGNLIARYNNRKDGDEFLIGKATLGGGYDGFRAFHVKELVLSSLHLGLNVLLSGIPLRNRDLASDWLDEVRWLEKKSRIEAVFADAEVAGILPSEEPWDAMEAEALAQGDDDIASKLRDLRRRGAAPPRCG